MMSFQVPLTLLSFVLNHRIAAFETKSKMSAVVLLHCTESSITCLLTPLDNCRDRPFTQFPMLVNVLSKWTLYPNSEFLMLLLRAQQQQKEGAVCKLSHTCPAFPISLSTLTNHYQRRVQTKAWELIAPVEALACKTEAVLWEQGLEARSVPRTSKTWCSRQTFNKHNVVCM